MGPALDEVVGPDVVRALRPQTDTGSVIEPEPALLWLFLWDLQPLPPPDPFDTLRVHSPSGLSQQGRDPAVAIAPILAGECDDIRGQRVFIGPLTRHFPLCRAVLPENPAGKPFRNLELLPDMIDAGTATGGAQKFPDAFG